MNPIKQNHEAMLRTGAMALAAAGASTAAHAATVQITFLNSFVSTTSGIAALDTDFGGDLVHDLEGVSFRAVTTGSARVYMFPPELDIFGYPLRQLAARGRAAGEGVVSAVGGIGNGWNGVHGQSVAVFSLLVPFTLVDTGVRGGAPTTGWIDMTATGRSTGELGRVDVHRFVFDDATGAAPVGVSHADAAFPENGAAAVPEPSGLGLLALGAGGLLARRRRAMAA
jgi:hypothetical protein